MTEPDVASSDATNIKSTIVRDGDHYVVNGHKWWTSGAGDPRCKVAIFMGKTNHGRATHQQQSMIFVNMTRPESGSGGCCRCSGTIDAPHGHGEMTFTTCAYRSPISCSAKERIRDRPRALGPGRIHHCMRLIGAAERALE